jgi:hypothetical protein
MPKYGCGFPSEASHPFTIDRMHRKQPKNHGLFDAKGLPGGNQPAIRKSHSNGILLDAFIPTYPDSSKRIIGSLSQRKNKLCLKISKINPWSDRLFLKSNTTKFIILE